MNRAQDFGIILEDVAITHLSFGAEVRFAALCWLWAATDVACA